MTTRYQQCHWLRLIIIGMLAVVCLPAKASASQALTPSPPPATLSTPTKSTSHNSTSDNTDKSNNVAAPRQQQPQQPSRSADDALRGGGGGGVKPPQQPSQREDPLVVQAAYVADAQLPTDMGDFRMRAYRVAPHSSFTSHTNAMEPMVIYAADKPPFGTDGNLLQNVPVRIHDQCLTSEVFRSRRCDCKEQLQLAMAHVQQHGGAVIYLQQEGRGIGLANKVAAYQLQDDLGLDTVDANLHLGFPEDCRHYGAVPSLLQDLRIASIRLMTNNPRKVARLKALGVHVVDTIPIVVHPNPHNVAYLTTKQDRMAHTNFGHILANDDLPLHGISNARQPLPSRSFRNEGMAPRRTSQTHHQQQPQP